MGAPRILMRSAVPSLSYALGVLQVFFIKAAFIFLNLLKVKGKCVIIVVRIKLRTAERGKESVACRLRRKSAIFFRGGSRSFKSARVFLFWGREKIKTPSRGNFSSRAERIKLFFRAREKQGKADVFEKSGRNKGCFLLSRNILRFFFVFSGQVWYNEKDVNIVNWIFRAKNPSN